MFNQKNMLFPPRAADGGFTRKEILIVIAFALITMVVIFIILNPVIEQRMARDATRWADVSSIMAAIKINQTENDAVIPDIQPGEVYMITRGPVTAGCDDANAFCGMSVTDDNNCLDLSGLTMREYFPEVPVSPRGKNKWVAPLTGYIIQKDQSGILMVGACESENSGFIWVAR